jgi:cytochrome c-type biogenesis protein CcmH/NrfG
MWRNFSSKSRSILAVLVTIGLVYCGCAPKVILVDSPSEPAREPSAGKALQPVPETEPPPPVTDERQSPAEPDPRALAALRLTDQARQRLDARQPDQAIRILERAVNLDPNNGRNFYFLAEAWLMKGDVAQAREFNRLAGIYLSGEDPSWDEKLKRQKERIEAAD